MKISRIKSVKRFYVTYFNGFSLKGEEALFTSFISETETTVVGFSYGAQKAFEFVYASKERIDRLILLSPAFFQTKKDSFLRTQLHYFKARQKAYVNQFLVNVSHPSTMNLTSYLKIETKEELEALLTYIWDEEKIAEVVDRGITVEVFLGSEDKIIDTKEALGFFSKLTATYSIKKVGHLLQSKEE